MIALPPIAAAFVDGQGKATQPTSEWLMAVYRIANAVYSSGTTSQRPAKELWVGRTYFDTTLNKPIWVKTVTPSVVWVDATGATV